VDHAGIVVHPAAGGALLSGRGLPTTQPYPGSTRQYTGVGDEKYIAHPFRQVKRPAMTITIKAMNVAVRTPQRMHPS
jgi:hypothetical protein